MIQSTLATQRSWFGKPQHGGQLALFLAALFLVACTATPPPAVEVYGDAQSLEALVGKWSGQYWSVESGRSGTITFTLEEDGVAAHGEVALFPKRDPNDDGKTSAASIAAQAPHRLAIRFVEASDGWIHGTTEPYDDPHCRCLVAATFDGFLDRDTIEGGYSSDGGHLHLSHTGKWRVTRKP